MLCCQGVGGSLIYPHRLPVMSLNDISKSLSFHYGFWELPNHHIKPQHPTALAFYSSISDEANDPIDNAGGRKGFFSVTWTVAISRGSRSESGFEKWRVMPCNMLLLLSMSERALDQELHLGLTFVLYLKSSALLKEVYQLSNDFPLCPLTQIGVFAILYKRLYYGCIFKISLKVNDKCQYSNPG